MVDDIAQFAAFAFGLALAACALDKMLHVAFHRPEHAPKHLAGRAHQRRADDALGPDEFASELDRLLNQYRAEHPDEFTGQLVVSKHRTPGDPNRVELDDNPEPADRQPRHPAARVDHWNDSVMQ